MIFVDQPVGVGFSYGHEKVDNDALFRKHFVKFITGFLAKHPEMRDRDFYLSGESSAGKYIPHIASEIIEYNKGMTDEEK
jgi:cathepsin A (carboxypeptidase C)